MWANYCRSYREIAGAYFLEEPLLGSEAEFLPSSFLTLMTFDEGHVFEVHFCEKQDFICGNS